MFDDEPVSKRDKLIGTILLSAMVVGFVAAMILFVTKWHQWTSR